MLLLDRSSLEVSYDPSEVGRTWAIKAAAAGQALGDVPIAWSGRLSGASGVPMRPEFDGGVPRPRSRWRGRIAARRAELPPSDWPVVWEWSQDRRRVRQVGALGPGRWSEPRGQLVAAGLSREALADS